MDNKLIYYSDDSCVGNSNLGTELYLYNDNINLNVELYWKYNESESDCYFSEIYVYHPSIREQFISSFGISAIKLIQSEDLIFNDILRVWLFEEIERLKDLEKMPFKTDYCMVMPAK